MNKTHKMKLVCVLCGCKRELIWEDGESFVQRAECQACYKRLHPDIDKSPAKQ